MSRPARHQIVLVPGLFGFARLGGFDYFMHVEEALETRFLERGLACDFVLVSSPPTASIVYRTEVLRDTIEQACRDAHGPIHLIGHSTGGLDIRLLASPTTWPEIPDWFERVQTATTIATPHYGTPLAYFFTTLAGTRVLEALSFLTYMTLRAGGPPLTILTPLVAMLGSIDLGFEIRALERMSDLLLAFLGEEGQEEVREWFAGIHRDQGAIIQLTPEAMDIFNAAAEDNPNLRYGCVVAQSPRPPPLNTARNLFSPARALSAAVFRPMHIGASRVSRVYPPPNPSPEAHTILEESFGRRLENTMNDGFVPTTSMIWGDILWAGEADHLDMLGHFDGDRDAAHTDWLVSGVGFREPDFDEVMDAVADFLLPSG